MNIAGRTFGPGAPCIAAEISCNHSGREDLAHALIDAAKEAGADAVKFQLYEPADLTLDSDLPHFRLTKGVWAGRGLWDLYVEAQTPRAWFPELFAHAREVGLIPFASVFSLEGVAYLESLGCPAYKIASAEVACSELVRVAAETGKPVVLSDGCASNWHMAEAMHAVGDDWTERCVVLRCTSEYPAAPASYSLGRGWRVKHWGVSDHTVNAIVPVTAAALGASMIEAHLMLLGLDYVNAARELGHPLTLSGIAAALPLDAGHSYEPEDFYDMVAQVRLAAKIAHTPHTEQRSTQGFRRRLVWARDLPSGHIVTPGDVLCVRCAEGCEPEELEDMVGDALGRAVKYGEPVDLRDVRAEAA